jgi:tetratricopeptide (TPR) repeat protein
MSFPMQVFPMKKHFLFCLFIFSVCVFSNRTSAFAAPSETPEEKTSAEAVEAQAPDLLRSNLQLQEQLHTALRAIEQGRQDAEAAAKKNADLFTERLNAVEKNLALQREHDLETVLSMRQSNRLALVAAAILAAVGILALFLTAFFQIRAMNRIAEVGSLLSSNHPFDPARAVGNGNGHHPVQLDRSEQVTSRFLAAVEQLEKRIHELDSVNSGANGALKETFSLADASETRSLLSEGQSLLNNSEAEKALLCFEKAIEMEPQCAEALIKKGTALEALRKLPEAIETYDRAIATNNSLTVAYLYKGGVLNRLQRFSEAMECYEQALRTHPKKAA